MLFRAQMPALSHRAARRLGPRQGVLSSSSHRSGRASHAARELGTGEDVVAYQARAAVRQKRACPDDAPRRARVPEGEASAGSEPAPGTVPPLTAAGTADAAREPPAPPTPSAPPIPPTRAAAIPLPNPGCSARCSSPANRLRRWCRRGDGGIPDRQDLHLPRALALLVFIAGPPTTAPSTAGRNARMSEGDGGGNRALAVRARMSRMSRRCFSKL